MNVHRPIFPFLHARREPVAIAPRADTRPADAPEPGFELALRLLEAGRWDEAFVALAVLANQGHPAAARIAMTMVCRGRSLFGGCFLASRAEQAQWLRTGEG